MAKTNKGRKLFATTATAALVASAIVPVASAAQVNDFNTVAPYAQDAVKDLVDRGVIEGDAKGNFNPKNSVTRAEGATILVKALDADTTGTINFTDVKAGTWYYDAINAAVNNGYFQGQGENKFNPSGNLTRSEAAIILVNAFGLEGSASLSQFSDAASVKSWAKEALEIAVATGVMKGDNGKLNPNANITKQDFAVMFSRTEEAAVNPAADLKDAVEGLKEAVAKLADKVTAENAAAAKTAVADTKAAIEATEKALEAAKEAKVVTDEEVKAIEEGIAAAKTKLEAAEKLVASYEESLTVAKVESVSATNLKQVVVAFNRSVDAATAENEENYSTTAGAIDSASLSEDGKTVTLTLAAGVVMENQKAYKLSILNVKAGDKVITQKDIAFSPLDNVLPTVSTVKSLGNKAIKVTFSEPIKNVTSSHFKLDDKTFFGSVTVTDNVVVLKPYDATALSIGDHKLTASLVEDYANLKSLTSTTDFTVVEDKEGPKVVEAVATLERATIAFDEEIDPETVTATDVYWLSGTTKKYPKSLTVVGGTKLVADFSNNPLPAYETTLYIDGISDYSSNVNSTKEVKITATVDQTRPTVTDVKLATNKIDITVKFDKAVSAGDKKYFTLTDKDGKVVPIKSAVATDATNKVFKVSTYSALTTAGTYNLKVSGVQDKTALMNTMLDYNTTFTVGDTGNPTILGLSASNSTRSVVITFSEKMDLASIADPSNYLIKLDTDGFGGNAAGLRTLPSDVEVRPVQDGKAVLLVFPKEIGTTGVSFPTADPITSAANFGSVQAITVTGVKDAAGNILATYTVETAVVEANATVKEYSSDYTGFEAVQTDQKTIKVKFSQPIGTVSASDFTLSNAENASITSAVANGDVVTLTTNKETGTDGVTLAVNSGNSIKTLAGNAVTASNVNVYDEVGPVTAVAENTSLVLANNKITLPFSENLSTTTGLPALYANDLVVKDLSKTNGTLTAGVDYTTAVSGKNIEITLIGQNLTSDFSVAVKADAKYIQDTNGNLAEESVTYQTGNNTGITPTGLTVTSGTNVITNAPTFAITGAATTGNTIKVYKDVNNDGLLDAGDTVEVTLTAASSAYSATVTLVADSANKYLVTETNGAAESAPLAVTITQDSTAPAVAAEDGTADKEGSTQSVDFDIIVTAETGAKVTATVAGANALKTVTDVTAAAGKATLPIDITKLTTGTNAIVITVTDAAGNASATFTVNVTK